MISQKQRYRFARHAGMFGDCHRTCVAMILNLPRDAVPHFMATLDLSTPADHPASKAAENAEIKWLARRGLTAFNVPFDGSIELDFLLEMFKSLAHGAPFILGCTSSNRTNHSVVIHDGQVHNPNDGRVVGPMNDGYWWLTIYSVGPNWRSPRLRDRVLTTLWRLRCRLLPARVRK